MSWSMQRLGNPVKMVKRIEKELESDGGLSGVELEIRNAVLRIAVTALNDFKGPYSVQLTASGHMSKWTSGTPPQEFSQQTVEFKVQPMGMLDE